MPSPFRPLNEVATPPRRPVRQVVTGARCSPASRPADPAPQGLPARSSGAGPGVVATVLVAAAIAWPPAIHAENDAGTPLVRGDDEVARLLNEWHAAGRAAGHAGVTYDNRDGRHSPLNLNRWPQIAVHEYSEADQQARRHLGPAGEVRPGIVIGNASMAAPAEQGGSLGRMYYTQTEGLRFLEAQYFSNNLYIYPEHRDHDPGLGDLYPTNTPYIVISQGSSGSDRPFMEAWVATVAAFQPDIRQALAQPGVLMPVMQYLFRRNLKGIESDDDYLSPRAHPVVYEGDWVDAARMVRMAQEMDQARIPPIVRLNVLDESRPEPNREFFEPARFASEELATQTSLVARIWRGTGGTRRMTVSAAESVDARGQPLTFRWQVLQGDPGLVEIEPQGLGDSARITWHWQGQRPSVVYPDRMSGRVDIGVFAFNGRTWSAPAMITWWSDPRELRAYDPDGRLLEVWYDAPNQDSGLPLAADPAWLNFLAITAESGTVGRELLRGGCDADQWDALERAWQQFGGQAVGVRATLATAGDAAREAEARAREAGETLDQAREQEADTAEIERLEAEHERLRELQQQANAARDQADRAWSNLGEEAAGWLDHPDHGAGDLTVRQILEAALFGMIHRSDLEAVFGERLSAAIREGRGGPVQHSRQMMEQFGLLERDGERWLPAPGLEQMPGGVMEHFHLHHLTLLRESVLADVLRPTGPRPLHDPRLTGRRDWRDIYQYDNDGRLLGWTRQHRDRTERFDADGRLLTGGGAAPVSYVEEQPGAVLQAVPRG